MISLVLNLLGIRPYLSQAGINYQALLIFSLIWGMAGSFISLLMSKQMVKWMYGVRIVDGDRSYQELVNIVHNLARSAGLSKMPEVGIYDAAEMNAFATGPSKNNSLVAVSQGLLNRMNRSEIEGVLGHEIAHIANGDMVTMTLIQGVVNSFVIFFARIAAFAVGQFLSRDEEGERGGFSPLVNMMLIMMFEIVFGLLGSMVTAWFSRYREYRADAGSARYAGRGQMIAALRRLQAETAPHPDMAAVNQLQISAGNKGRSRFIALFASHPALEDRIEALEKGRV
jgi:heat shock protein HtpX